MKKRDLSELVLLAAIWGASSPLMRAAVPEFGPVALAAVRLAGGAMVLLPLVAGRGELTLVARHWRPLLVLGVTNFSLPILFFGYAMLTITAGLGSIFNAASPLFGAAIGWLWLRDRLNAPRTIGLVVGFTGVFGLAWSKSSLHSGTDGMQVVMAVTACLLSTLAYGFSANFAKRYLADVPPTAVAAGSLLGATLVLAVPAVVWWPAAVPSASAWANVALLATVCTGFGFLLYFRLIAHAGPTNAITVTFLMPAFAVSWGSLFLGERVTWPMVAGCAVILLGTSLAIGLVRPAALASPKGAP